MPDDLQLEHWKRTVDGQLSSPSAYASACARMAEGGITFRARILTSANASELRASEDKLTQFLSSYGLDVSVEYCTALAATALTDWDEFDLVIVLPLSNDIEVFCVEFAQEATRAAKMIVCVPEGRDGDYYCRRVREVYGVATVPLPFRSLVDGLECRFGIDLMRRCANALMNKVAESVRLLRIQNTVVVLLHGIRTRATWQTDVKDALQAAGLIAIPTSYSKFDIMRFFFPLEWFRRAPVQKVRSDIAAVRARFPGRAISLIAHSFGTYIAGKLMLSKEFVFDRIAFCGCVLRTDFDFGAAGEFSEIVNEVGCRDVWPVLAAKVSGNYGPTGSFGFNRGNFVEDRKHATYNHSQFLNGDFCTRFWVPFFCDGRRAASGDVGALPSKLVRFCDGMPVLVLTKIIVWGAPLALLVAICWVVLSFLG